MRASAAVASPVRPESLNATVPRRACSGSWPSRFCFNWADLAVLTAWGAAALLIATSRFSWLPRGT